MNSEERLKRIFAASLEQLTAIDSILEGKAQSSESVGPLFLKLGQSAKFFRR